MKTLILGILSIGVCSACQFTNQESASPTYGEAFFADEQNALVFSKSNFPGDVLALDSGWIYLGMDSIPGIDRDLPEFSEGELIHLPHRITAPNHSFWYQKEVRLEPGILWIDADDGAQLWANGIRIPRASDGEYFELQSSGNFLLSIRGVNNAMAGGLRKVRWISLDDFKSWEEKQQEIRDSILVSWKAEKILDQKVRAKLKGLTWKSIQQELLSFPVLKTDPVLILGTDQTWFVRWVSENPGTTQVHFQDGTVRELVSENGVFTLPVSGDSDVGFDLVQENSRFGPFHFSFPREKEKLKLALWGDSQGGWNTFRKIAKGIRDQEVDLSIGAGDLVNNGSDPLAYFHFLQILSEMNAPQLPVPGNHDYDGFYDDLDPGLLRQFVYRESEPTYGYRKLGPLAVFTLDPNENFPVSIPNSSDQFKVMKEVLESEEWKKSPWKMIVLHQPPYAQGWQGYQGEISIRNVLQPYFEAGLVDLVVAGHTHDYERLTLEFSGHPVHFLILGGAGGGLEPIGKDSDSPKMDRLIKKHHFGILEIKKEGVYGQVFGLDGEELDHFSFKK